MGLFDFLKNQLPAAKPAPVVPSSVAPPATPPTPTTPAANPDVTRIEREHFLLHAPSRWTAVPRDNPMEFEFRNQKLKDQLIVTVLIPREPFNAAKQRWIAEDLANKRLAALASVSGGRAVHSPLQFLSGSDQIEVRCFACDEPNKVRVAFVIRVAAAKIVTVAYTRYFLEEIVLPFEDYVCTIFDFIEVKNPGTPAPA